GSPCTPCPRRFLPVMRALTSTRSTVRREEGHQVCDFFLGEELQPHNLQTALHAQLEDGFTLPIPGADDLPLERIGGSFPDPFRRSTLNQRHDVYLLIK